MDESLEIERSIIKKFRKDIWSRFMRGISDYELINENDRIMVCISGGKDSFLLAKCMQELMRHGKVKFDCKFVLMDPGYREESMNVINANAKKLNIPLEIFQSDIFASVDSMDLKSPCYMCARMRRGHLYNKAQELGCNKIALGHHFDDVIETSLLSMLYGSEIKTMLPKLHSDNYVGIDLIRPLYLVKESAIKAWVKSNNLTFINCACKFTMDNNELDLQTSKRKEIKELINNLRKINPEVDNNIFKAFGNINMNCILGYHDEQIKHSFLDKF